tara:strand:+ start:131 stop:478 length:348 start_codon:yes stop_codon:yes gene_type:complete
VILLGSSCQDQTDNERKKQDIISKKELVEVLKDVLIEEARSDMRGIDNKDSLDLYKRYKQIYIEKFSEEDFRKSLEYYSKNLDDLEGIYTDVVDGLITEKDSIHLSLPLEMNQSQ